MDETNYCKCPAKLLNDDVCFMKPVYVIHVRLSQRSFSVHIQVNFTYNQKHEFKHVVNRIFIYT